MTDELKTLKDITSWTCKCRCITFDGEICRACKKPTEKYGEIPYDEARQEAIKWAKALNKKKEEHYSNDKRWTDGNFTGFEFEGVYWSEWEEASDIEGAIKILKKVFNLSEEDLK